MPNEGIFLLLGSERHLPTLPCPPPSPFPLAVTSSLPLTLILNEPLYLQEHCCPHPEKIADCCLLACHSTRQRPGGDAVLLDHRVAAAREVGHLLPTEVRALSRGPWGRTRALWPELFPRDGLRSSGPQRKGWHICVCGVLGRGRSEHLGKEASTARSAASWDG